MNYIDIETVPAFKTFEEADERTQNLFIKKCRAEIESDGGNRDPYEIAKELYPTKAGLFAEFNKIICVSLGAITLPAANSSSLDKSSASIYIKSFYGHDEAKILSDLSAAFLKGNMHNLCAHFGKGFDYPVLARKYVIHKIPIPGLLNISGLKPWEVPLHDTQDMWKFGDMRHSCSLDLLAHCFGLPSPKEFMDGSEVGHYYYNDPDGLEKIVKYCEADVRTLINVHRVMTYQNPILE